jgi:hypothetical protein
MPFKSKAQQRFMFAAEERGDVPKGTAREWAHKTKSIKKLPERVHHKKSAAELAMEALDQVTARVMSKEAAATCPGSKIRSEGKGRGMGTGQGKGPIGVPVGEKWDALKKRAKKKEASDIANAVLATDGAHTSVMHDLFNGGSWAPGGVEYQGPMKIAAELPTNVADRATSTIGSIIGAPKPKMPKLPKPPKPPKTKKTAAEIADFVIKKAAAQVA